MEVQENQELEVHDVKPSGYKVVSVLLLNSSFSRKTDMDFNIQDISHEIEVKPTAHETAPDNKFVVTLNLLYKGLHDKQQLCSSDITMIGVFEKYGEPALSEDKFKAINAPAIIYPFIREHLFNLCLRAGIANVLLPTVNFKP
ncbi:MAG: protein-export chaperone SecB [Segetibacter sp.]